MIRACVSTIMFHKVPCMVAVPSGPRVNGHAIRVIRQRSDMTLVELAAKCGVSRAYLNNIELGNRHPSPELLTAIARTLKAPKVALYADPSDGEAA